MSWALIAQSAMKGGASGILAASQDIAETIEAGDISQVFVFPKEDQPAGIYLWEGTADPEDWEYTGAHRRLQDWFVIQGWINRNGEAP